MGGGKEQAGDAGAQDARLFSPASQRNREPILEVLRRVLPSSGILLEVASGTGEHAAFMAPQLSPLIWQPSDADDAMRSSIEAHVEATNSPNLMPPLRLDVHQEVWPLTRADALVCCNMTHITPWSATEALFHGAGRLLSPGGVLYLYGPYITEDRPTAPSNLAFDEDLKRRNPDWGLRRLEEVVLLAEGHGLILEEVVEMPANNLSVVFHRS